MLALVIALFAAVWLVAGDDNPQITVHGSVVFARNGDRTSILDGGANDDRTLTSLGAQQLYQLGEAFRGRYINQNHGEGGLGNQPIANLSPNLIENQQISVLVGDDSIAIASAQSFMMGFYPPFMLNETSGQAYDEANLLANGTYLDYPLSGYQFPQIVTATDYDPLSIWVDGNGDCPNALAGLSTYAETQEFEATRNYSQGLYFATGFKTKLGEILTSEAQWDYYMAYDIWDYLSYEYAHDTDTYDFFGKNESNSGWYDDLRQLANQHEFAIWGNLTSPNQINAIAGKTLAAKVLGAFEILNDTAGVTPKFSLMIGEHEPFLSLFALMEMHLLNDAFAGIPNPASAMVFELFSVGGDGSFPTDEKDLWVRFLFHNGSDISSNGSLQAFPMFGYGPSQTDMSYIQFADLMSRIMTASVADWCTLCGSTAIFCLGFNSDNITIVVPDKKESDMTPQVAGVIGAAVTLGVLAIAFILAMLVGGIRFHRVQRGKRSEMGGFKGGDKLHSDADLSLPKNGAVAGITSLGGPDDKKKAGHERVGSWELRAKEGDIGDNVSRRESLEEEHGVSPFAKPVVADDKV